MRVGVLVEGTLEGVCTGACMWDAWDVHLQCLGGAFDVLVGMLGGAWGACEGAWGARSGVVMLGGAWGCM